MGVEKIGQLIPEGWFPANWGWGRGRERIEGRAPLNPKCGVCAKTSMARVGRGGPWGRQGELLHWRSGALPSASYRGFGFLRE